MNLVSYLLLCVECLEPAVKYGGASFLQRRDNRVSTVRDSCDWAARINDAGYAIGAACTVRGTLGDFSIRGYCKHTPRLPVVNIFAAQLLTQCLNPISLHGNTCEQMLYINITSPSTVRIAAKTSMTCCEDSTQGSIVTAT